MQSLYLLKVTNFFMNASFTFIFSSKVLWIKNYKETQKSLHTVESAFAFLKLCLCEFFVKKSSQVLMKRRVILVTVRIEESTNVENGIRFHNWQNCTFAWHVQNRGSVGRDQYTSTVIEVTMSLGLI